MYISWHRTHCDAHPCFRRLGTTDDADGGAALASSGGDPAVAAMVEVTEEGQKVSRAGNAK